jgi:hypothetical protein
MEPSILRDDLNVKDELLQLGVLHTGDEDENLIIETAYDYMTVRAAANELLASSVFGRAAETPKELLYMFLCKDVDGDFCLTPRHDQMGCLDIIDIGDSECLQLKAP